jgi:hypothetical protein
MPPRNPQRDPFGHKWERIATAWGNLEVLAQPNPAAMERILRSTAKLFTSSRVSIRPTFLAATAFGALTPDLCARAAANNLNKLVLERAELVRLSPPDRQTVDAKLRELSAKCSGFELQLSISPTRRDRLIHTLVKFRETY